MKWTPVKENIGYFSDSVNIGYMMKEGKGILIDTGIDKSSVKKVLSYLKKHNFPLDYCILTHSHADHIGGFPEILKKSKVECWAPEFEKSLMVQTRLEPIYLWNGAEPLQSLRSKFLEAPSIPEDCLTSISEEGIIRMGPFELTVYFLKGHSYQQIGVLYEDVLFASDSYFGREVASKHKILFIVDAKETLHTLNRIKTLPFKWSIPGHGEVERKEATIETLQYNEDLHQKCIKTITTVLGTEKLTVETILEMVLNHYEIQCNSVSQWLLFRTSITAYVTSLIHDGNVEVSLKHNKMVFSIAQT
ncbi:hypothetical protein Q73_04220 [Bacillus coahuilensis m2-6]|uniref:MBL fold metallo-hydrolase n=1 Tax=Bacillus coahuilensis TaxID=408580 RepID=UPI0001850F6E|nr:MBL fold metallo-hydrolase [Bacillus coahuilensis]KUP09017.1 hypothetical protein Q73_04220 [Bacillus coahuilensis m2-6]